MAGSACGERATGDSNRERLQRGAPQRAASVYLTFEKNRGSSTALRLLVCKRVCSNKTIMAA